MSEFNILKTWVNTESTFYTKLPECQGTLCSKQAKFLKVN